MEIFNNKIIFMILLIYSLFSYLTVISYRGNNIFKIKLPCSLRYSTNEISCYFLLNEKICLPAEKSQTKYSSKSFFFNFDSLQIPSGTYVTDFVCDITATGHRMRTVDGETIYEPLYTNKYSEKHRIKLTIDDNIIVKVMAGFY